MSSKGNYIIENFLMFVKVMPIFIKERRDFGLRESKSILRQEKNNNCRV